MNDNIVQLNRILEELDSRIEKLESSPVRNFIFENSDTLRLFHFFNLHIKKFWKVYDRNLVGHILLLYKLLKRHSELKLRYEKIILNKMGYLKGVIDTKNNALVSIPIFTFSEDNEMNVIGYYKERLENIKDEEGNPLYNIELNDDIHSKILKFESDKYTFRSKKLNESYFECYVIMHDILINIYSLIRTVCSYPDILISDFNPSNEEIINTLEKELRIYAKREGENVYRELRKLYFLLKRSNKTSQSTDIWRMMMDVEDEVFSLAIKGQLVDNKEKPYEFISLEERKLWSDNKSLLQTIKDTCIDDELFDVRMAVEKYDLIQTLNYKNLSLLYELVLRRNIIHREMYPGDLAAKYEEWLNSSDKNKLVDSEDSNSNIGNTPNNRGEGRGPESAKFVADKNKADNIFRYPSDFVKQKLSDVIKNFFKNSSANLALIEVTLYHHNQIYRRNYHKAFVKALVAWNLIEVASENDLAKIVRAVTDKYKRLPKDGYMLWDANHADDKSYCENISCELGDTMPYNG